MTTRDTPWRDGTPCWADLGAPDIAKARAFYSDVFSWTVQPGGAGERRGFGGGAKQPGGRRRRPEDGSAGGADDLDDVPGDVGRRRDRRQDQERRRPAGHGTHGHH